MNKNYSELIQIPSFEERYEYLKIGGSPGRSTFGFDRYLNQRLYHSIEWKNLRSKIITRDMGCDLGVEEREILDKIIIHHIIPITKNQLLDLHPLIFDEENLICTSFLTHQAIHYADKDLLSLLPQERRKGDTTLWRAF